MGKTQNHVRRSGREGRKDLQAILTDFCQGSRENYQQPVGHIAKSYIFAAPFKKGDQTAEVAQSVEHQPSKLRVAGSNLVFRSHHEASEIETLRLFF